MSYFKFIAQHKTISFEIVLFKKKSYFRTIVYIHKWIDVQKNYTTKEIKLSGSR